ncbi:MAG TPA: hypothetical protein VFL87_02110, partial [Thermoleophilaceae bacterium]|nr:hypothetical protein [Thermoleophilaceae bacterium]
MLPHGFARTAARCLAVAVLVLALLAPDAVVSAAAGSAHPQSAHTSAKKKRKHHRRCLRYRRVRVKRHHRT